MPTVRITGACRGSGLELARQYAAEGWRVLATCRNPDAATELKAVPGDLRAHRLDVDDPASLDALAAALRGEPVDLLLNNAGINHRASSVHEIDYGAWAETMATNLFGPIRVAAALMDNVLASDRKIMAFTSSRMGSIADNGGGSILYRTSTNALNIAVSCLAKENGNRGPMPWLPTSGPIRK